MEKTIEYNGIEYDIKTGRCEECAFYDKGCPPNFKCDNDLIAKEK